MGLKQCRSVLDVGCGIGHWGLTLAPFLDPDCKVVGIDPEPQWVTRAIEGAKQKNEANRFQYQLETAEEISFEDNTFDMVTCQTVLIHVKDVTVALKEMLRVLKPGGILAVAEPSNIAPYLVSDNLSMNTSIDDVLVIYTVSNDV